MNNPKIKIKVKNYGEIEAELYPDQAPATVENFLSLIKNGFLRDLFSTALSTDL